jgi:hypothetical protein
MKIIFIILGIITISVLAYFLRSFLGNKATELVVVFKKEISEEKSLEIMNKIGYAFRSGMDSSKGKVYFYSTGPKFIVDIISEENIDTVINKYTSFSEVFEIYKANWNIVKD